MAENQERNMNKHHCDPNRSRMTKIRYALWVAPLLAFFFAATVDAADPLNAAQRAWLKDKGTITFVSQTAYPPFEFLNQHGNPQGMCIDLAQWMAAELGFKAAFRDMAFKEAQDAVLSGDVDVLTSLFYSKERDKRFDFSEMTWEVPALIFVRAERPDITSLADLQGKRIAMQRGDYAAEFLASKGIAYDLVPTATFAEAADRVIAGEADAVIGDQQIVLYHLFTHDLTSKVKSVDHPLYIGSNRLAVREGQGELVGILNTGLALARERGIFERVTRKWVGTYYVPKPSWFQRHARQLVITLAAVTFFAALLIVWGIRLRSLVMRRTRELFEARDAARPFTPQTLGKSGLKMWLWIFAVLIPLCGGGDYILRNHVILPSYLALEKQEAEKAIAACVDAVKREMHRLEQMAGAWAMWDDTYRFVQDANPAYVQSDFQWKRLTSSGIHLIYIFDRQIRTLWWGAFDPAENMEVSLDPFSNASFTKDHPLFQHATLDSTITGVILTERGPILITSRPIVTSAGEGPMQGILVMGRFLNEETIRELSSQTRVPFSIKHPRSAHLDNRQSLLFTTLAPGKQGIETVDDKTLKGYALLADLDGNPALLINATLEREIFQRSKATARLVSIVILAAIVILVVFLCAWSLSFAKEVFHRQAHIEALVKQRTSALQESESKFRELADLLPQTIFETDAQGRLTYLNKVAFQTFGYTEEDFEGGLSALDMLVPEERDKTGENFARIMAGEDIPAEEYRALRKDGTTFPTIIHSSSIRHGAKSLGLRGIVVDLTEREKAEEEKEKLRVQLVQAQKVESIGRLAGGVAHDLNNLLSPIIGYSEMLQDDIAPEDARRDQVDQILRAGMRARDLVRQLLAFSRKQTLEFKAVEINKAIAGFEKFLRRTIQEDIELELILSPDPLTVMADVGQIEQVLMNLAINAADAMPEGGTLTIETARVDLDEKYCAEHIAVEPGPYALLAISDTGCGMDQETQEKIFEPFFSTKGEGGTGLGLATVYGIVKQHGGNIWVYSEPGKGTTFKIYLPVYETASAEETTDKKEMVDLTGIETILLVEDNDQVRELSLAILHRQGYSVITAENGLEALAVLDRHEGPVHLLLTDVVMPEMNGRDLFAKAAERHPGLKVLYMSGYTDDVIAHRGVLDQGVAFIQKPFSVKDLVAKVRETLDR
jgi:PAS domain S-box-containing protein